MTTVREILANKGNCVWAVDPEDSVYKALEIMSEKDIGSLLVMQGRALVGILTERDYARKVILRGKSSRNTRVCEIMASPVIVVGLDATCNECRELMTTQHIRHLPVMEGSRVVGVISMRDVMEEIIYDQTQTIQFWEDLSLDR